MRPHSVLLAAAAATATAIAAPALARPTVFDNTVLIANVPDYHPTIAVNPDLVDAWGIALRPPGAGGHIWISCAGTGTSIEYQGDVNGVPLHQDGLKIVPLDNPAWLDLGHQQASGQVYNAASDIPGQPVEFFVSGPGANFNTDPPTPVGTVSGSAKFVFVTLDGTINAWRSSTNPAMYSAVIMFDHSMTSTSPWPYARAAAYSGCAMTTDAAVDDGHGHLVADNRLYVCDFENDRIQVFNNQWQEITDTVHFDRPPSLPDGFHPFNIMWLGGRLYVAYAFLNPVGESAGEDLDAPGLGHIASFDRDGHLIHDFDQPGVLNAPWGMAIAPPTWGRFAGDLMVANFGDGTIVAYDLTTGLYDDTLKDRDGNIISIDGLWGLAFGNGVALGDANAMYYTAGPNHEGDGIFGRLNLVVTGCNPADIVSVGQTTPPDGQLTGDDYVAFINAFFTGSPLADIVSVGQQPPPDGLLTGDDYVAFINNFFAGCTPTAN